MTDAMRGVYARVPALPEPATSAPASSSAMRWHPPRRTLVLLVPAALAVLYLLSTTLSVQTLREEAYAAEVPTPAADEAVLASLASDQAAAAPTGPVDGAQKGAAALGFEPRKPCNALTTSLAPSSSSSPFLSPSPPLPPSAPLADRLSAWISAPLAPASAWSAFSAQTCGNPSVRRAANQLHFRENRARWDELGEGEVRRIRREMVERLRADERAGRLEEWQDEGKKGTRGIVWTAGNADTFDRVLTALRLLRSHGCTLPAQVFHFPSEHPSESQEADFASLSATVSSLASLSKDAQAGRTKSFHLKGAALAESAFDEVLLLDSDNIPVRNVEFLFDSAEFREMGAVFWPDYFKDQPENAIWSILGIQCRDEFTMEAGQILVRKSQHLDALLLVEHWLEDWRFWFQFSDGDKDLFRYAFLALRKRWAVPARHLAAASWLDPLALGSKHEREFAGHSMVQFGLASEDGFEGVRGRPLFVHANLLKRVISDMHDGNTFGRTLQLRLPSAAPISDPSSSNTASPSYANTSDSTSTSSPFVFQADHLANVSPFTGLGIPVPAASAVPLWARQRALLLRGASMRFWAGHRKAAYVLAVEPLWRDELAEWEDERVRGVGEDEGLQMSQDEWDQWRGWVARERDARCEGDEEGDIREMLAFAKEDKAEGARDGLEVVLWADDPDLAGLEHRFYNVGRGKAGASGFR
ncbi:uncharacterized protein JCM10292_007130 [Rhodotorula paludigena]|uniref:uncharacterized protein n=1 Tax=Rhodotorula paludigena TaxID=86838 RepID=UPI00316CABD8